MYQSVFVIICKYTAPYAFCNRQVGFFCIGDVYGQQPICLPSYCRKMMFLLVVYTVGNKNLDSVYSYRYAFLEFCYTVFDLISEHALISGHPPFFVLKKKYIYIYNFFF